MAEDTSNAKWNQLQEMRKARGDVPPPKVEATPEPAADPAAVAAEQARLEAEAAKPPVVETPKVESAPAVETPPAASATPNTVEIEIDGQKVHVDPTIAAAFASAEKVKKDTTQAAERAALKAEIAAEIRATISAPVAEKTAAQLAAEKALEDAARLKMPDESLMISDPKKFKEQMADFIAQEKEDAKNAAVAEVRTELRQRDVTARQNQEQAARDSLRQQFYVTYPAFKGNETVVDAVLAKKWDEVAASGRLNKPFTAQEAEALRTESFADVATRATREIVNVMNAGKRVVPPTPPPTLVSSAPAKAPAPKKEEPEKPKERYPKGSVSAMLAARKASREPARA